MLWNRRSSRNSARQWHNSREPGYPSDVGDQGRGIRFAIAAEHKSREPPQSNGIGAVFGLALCEALELELVDQARAGERAEVQVRAFLRALLWLTLSPAYGSAVVGGAVVVGGDVDAGLGSVVLALGVVVAAASANEAVLAVDGLVGSAAWGVTSVPAPAAARPMTRPITPVRSTVQRGTRLDRRPGF